MHPMDSSFCAKANIFWILAPDSSPEPETLRLWLMVLESQDVGLWLPGAMAGLCPDGWVWAQASRRGH